MKKKKKIKKKKKKEIKNNEIQNYFRVINENLSKSKFLQILRTF